MPFLGPPNQLLSWIYFFTQLYIQTCRFVEPTKVRVKTVRPP